MSYAATFFAAAAQISPFVSIEALTELDRLRERNVWLFLMASATAPPLAAVPSMMVRKLCGIKTYSPVDNISELTARTNDERRGAVFAASLDTSHLSDKDAILIYSVGGGDAERNISANIVRAIDPAKARSAKCLGSWVEMAVIP
jgi:D-sedoheptulose 7-phosphate isomerase